MVNMHKQHRKKLLKNNKRIKKKNVSIDFSQGACYSLFNDKLNNIVQQYESEEVIL